MQQYKQKTSNCVPIVSGHPQGVLFMDLAVAVALSSGLLDNPSFIKLFLNAEDPTKLSFAFFFRKRPNPHRRLEGSISSPVSHVSTRASHAQTLTVVKPNQYKRSLLSTVV